MFLRFLTASWLKILLWVAVIVQGLLALWISHPWTTADSAEYLKLADSLGAGLGYGAMTADGFQPDVLRPPGYPLLLSFFLHTLGLPLVAVAATQLLVFWASLWLVQRMLVRFAIEPAPMLALAAAYPFPAMYSVNIMTEAWAGLAVTGIAALLVLGKRGVGCYALAGAIAGAATLFRADLLLLAPFIGGLVFLMALHRREQLGRAIGLAAAPVVAALLVLLPYMAWNQAHFAKAKPVPLAGALGNSLYIASWQPILPFKDIVALYDGVVTPRAESAGLGGEVRAINASIGAPPLTAPWNPSAYPTRRMQIESTERTLEQAKRRIADQPTIYARHVASNSWQLWNTANYPPSIPAPGVVFLRLMSALVWAAGMAGVVLSFARPGGWLVPAWLAGLFLYVPAIHLFLHTEARYTAPDRPLLLLLAAATCWWAIERLSARSQTKMQHA
jgi:hypothetical protein